MEKEAVIDAVRDFIEGEGYGYEYNAEREFLSLGFKIDCKLKHVDIIIDFHPRGVIVYAISPISAGQECFPEMRKYLSLANFGLINGSFEMNPKSGEVRYRCWLSTWTLDSLSKEMIDEIINVAYTTLKRYGDGIAALALGFSDAEAEIAKAEAPAPQGGEEDTQNG